MSKSAKCSKCNKTFSGPRAAQKVGSHYFSAHVRNYKKVGDVAIAAISERGVTAMPSASGSLQAELNKLATFFDVYNSMDMATKEFVSGFIS